MISLRRLLCGSSPIGQLDEDIAIDRELVGAEDAAAVLGRALALALPTMRPFEATHLASMLALSTDPLKRASIAKALGWRFTLVGDDLVIDHLVLDCDPLVRGAAEEAAVTRRG